MSLPTWLRHFKESKCGYYEHGVLEGVLPSYIMVAKGK